MQSFVHITRLSLHALAGKLDGQAAKGTPKDGEPGVERNVWPGSHWLCCLWRFEVHGRQVCKKLDMESAGRHLASKTHLAPLEYQAL